MSEEIRFLLTSLSLIVALLIVYYLLSRYGLNLKVKGGGYLEVLDRLPLSTESGLVIFRAGKKKYLGFYSKGNFQLLKEIDDEESSSSSTNNSFSSLGGDT